MKPVVLLFWLFLLFSCVIGCASARRGEPLVGPMDIYSPSLVAGQQVFLIHCHQCHPGGEAGLGPAINNKPLPNFLMKAQVRNGFGAMPSFSEEKISDTELEYLIDYLKELRMHG